MLIEIFIEAPIHLITSDNWAGTGHIFALLLEGRRRRLQMIEEGRGLKLELSSSTSPSPVYAHAVPCTSAARSGVDASSCSHKFLMSCS